MNFISTLREKSQTKRQEDVTRLANDLITVADFDGKLYIAYQSNPLILLDDNLTSTEILQKLSETRNNYINAKVKDLC